MSSSKSDARVSDPDTHYAIGVGLQRSKDDSVHHMGHLWLRWQNPFTNEVSYRGYWPVLDDLPDNLDPDEMRDFLCTRSVRGVYKVDEHGRDMETTDQPHKRQDWAFDRDSYFRLTMFHCVLTDGMSYRFFGHYSCNEKLENTDNCSSWAINALRTSRKDSNFIECERTKRLKYVEQAIWGDKT